MHWSLLKQSLSSNWLFLLKRWVSEARECLLPAIENSFGATIIYQTIPLNNRHFYEVIQENKPCKLYFDLEFTRKGNEDRDGESMTRVLILKVIEKVRLEFDIVCTFEDVLILDSTTDNKFSIHLVFNNKCLVFANNHHVATFVEKFIQDLKIEDRIQFEASSENGKKLFIDEGVYTKNRNFRLFLSTKFGKQRNLCISSMDLHSVCYAENNQNINKYQLEKQIFLCSLITNIDKNSQDMMKLCCINQDNFQNTKPILLTHTHKDTSFTGKSPFTEVDNFVLDLVSPGFIRKWRYLPDTSSIIYEIGGTRFCANVGREHKSNNVFFLADLRQGAVFQKCHDPDCSGFRSPQIILPQSTLPWKLMAEWNGEEIDNVDRVNGEEIDNVDRVNGEKIYSKNRVNEEKIYNKDKVNREDLVCDEIESEAHNDLNDNSDEILLV